MQGTENSLRLHRDGETTANTITCLYTKGAYSFTHTVRLNYFFLKCARLALQPSCLSPENRETQGFTTQANSLKSEKHVKFCKVHFPVNKTLYH